MKKIAIMLMLAAITAINVSAQVIHPGDSITQHAYVNVLYTDSETYRYNVPLRMTIDVIDHQDSVLGAAVYVHLYYQSGKSFAPVVGTQFRGMVYDGWNASDEGAVLHIVADDWAVRHEYLSFTQ